MEASEGKCPEKDVILNKEGVDVVFIRIGYRTRCVAKTVSPIPTWNNFKSFLYKKQGYACTLTQLGLISIESFCNRLQLSFKKIL